MYISVWTDAIYVDLLFIVCWHMYVHVCTTISFIFQDCSTPLHYAAACDHIECVQILLSVPGIELNVKNERANTPVMVAQNYVVLNLLKKYIKNCEDFPIHSFGKVIICGHSEAGKSTLAQVSGPVLCTMIYGIMYLIMSCEAFSLVLWCLSVYKGYTTVCANTINGGTSVCWFVYVCM